MLKIAAQVYEGLSEEEINEIEQIARDRSKRSAFSAASQQRT